MPTSVEFYDGGLLRYVNDQTPICHTCGKSSYIHNLNAPYTAADCSGFTHPLQPSPVPPAPENKPMEPTLNVHNHTYGLTQTMTAKFPGRCHICRGAIVAHSDVIVPVLSARTPRGRHPWAHVMCIPPNNKSPKPATETVPEKPASKWLVDPPPVSQRQLDVVAQNLERVLRALANKPTQAFALVEVATQTAVLTTDVAPPPPAESTPTK